MRRWMWIGFCVNLVSLVSCSFCTVGTSLPEEPTLFGNGYRVWDSYFSNLNVSAIYSDCVKFHEAGLLSVKQKKRDCGNLTRIIDTLDKFNAITSSAFKNVAFVSESTRYLVKSLLNLATILNGCEIPSDMANFGVQIDENFVAIMLTRYHQGIYLEHLSEKSCSIHRSNLSDTF